MTTMLQDRIFSEDAFAWVDAIVAVLVAAWVALVLAGTYVSVRADDPSTPLIVILLTTVLTIAVLLMVVLRTLLRQATALRTDLETNVPVPD